MKPSVVIKEIHEYVDQADQRFLTLVYNMVQAEKENQKNSKDELQAEMIRRAEASEMDIVAGRTINVRDFKLKLEAWKTKKRVDIK